MLCTLFLKTGVAESNSLATLIASSDLQWDSHEEALQNFVDVLAVHINEFYPTSPRYSPNTGELLDVKDDRFCKMQDLILGLVAGTVDDAGDGLLEELMRNGWHFSELPSRGSIWIQILELAECVLPSMTSFKPDEDVFLGDFLQEYISITNLICEIKRKES